MKNLSLIIALFFAFTTTTFAQVSKLRVQPNLTTIKTNKIPRTQNFQQLNTATLKSPCPDPAAAAINFSIVRRYDQFRASVKIEGVVTNQGAQYATGRGQQMIVLYEIIPGHRPVEKARRAFGGLAPRQSVAISFVRHWNISSPAEGEFPPTYKVCIVYDPDITLDGNPRNDDCNSGNNCKSRNGLAISELFRRPTRR